MSAGAGTGPVPAVLPPGVEAGPLERRLAASVVDNLIPAVIGILYTVSVTVWVQRFEALLVLSVVAAVLSLFWAMVVWWMLAVGAASPGMRLMKLQLVGLADGRPIGWLRVLLRQLVWAVLTATGIGLVALVVTLVLDVRRQGWHDKVANAVVIRERAARPSREQPAQQSPRRQAPPTSSTVGLPAHLTGQRDFSGRPGSSAGSAGSASSAGEWAGPRPEGWAPAGGQAPGSRNPLDPGTPGQGPGPYGAGAAGPQGQAPLHQPGPASASSAADWRPTATQPPVPAGPATPSVAPAWTPPPAPAAAPQAAPDPAQDERSRWGRPAEGERPTTSAASVTPPPPQEPLDDGTRVVARGSLGRRAPDEGWVLALEDGRQIPVSSLVLIGRNPQPRPGEEHAELVKVGDESRTVSKTHIAIGVDKRGIYVVDRGSTNGSAIANSSGEYEPCAPGDVVRVREGQLVSYGQNRLEIKRVFSS